MFPVPEQQLLPNTYAYEARPMVRHTGFREYDARWIFGKEINLMGVQALGMGLGTLLGELGVKREIVVGHYYRSYSASIKLALVTGLMRPVRGRLMVLILCIECDSDRDFGVDAGLC